MVILDAMARKQPTESSPVTVTTALEQHAIGWTVHCVHRATNSVPLIRRNNKSLITTGTDPLPGNYLIP